MRDKVFYTICFGFIMGVLCHSFILFNISVEIFILFLSICLFLCFLFIFKNKLAILISVFLVALSFGIIRFSFFENNRSVNFDKYLNINKEFEGIIIDEPKIGEKNQKFPVLVELNQEKTKILISTDLMTDYVYGDRIIFSGKLQKPENFITEQGKEFDYVNYLRKDEIFYIATYPRMQILSHNNGFKIKSFLFFVKGKFLEKINLVVNPPESLLIGGLILGEKASFNQELTKQFVDTGTIHIIALSGYNVTIVAEWIMKLFKFLPMNFGIGVGIFSILLFILMTGASSTALRAGIMASLALVARATGRNYDVARALVLALILMLLFNPYLLAFDVSFQLSFLATIAVIFLTPRVEKYLMWLPKKFELRDIVSVTIAAYIFVLPFILYKMGNLSLVALPTNILILPFIPFTMLLGFLNGIIGFIFPIASLPIGFLASIFLHYELSIIKFFASLPFASFVVPNFPLFLTMIVYGYFTWLLFRKNIRDFFIDIT